MARKLGILDRICGKLIRFEVPLSKVVTVFGATFGEESSNHIKKTLELYDRNPDVSFRETPLYPFLKTFCPTKLRDYVAGVSTDLPLFEFPWGELVPGMATKDRGQSRFCGPSTDEFVEEEFHRIIALYQKIKREGYLPGRVPGGYSAGTFLLGEKDYRFIVLQGNHRVPILSHLGYRALSVTLYPFYIKPFVKLRSAAGWEHVKAGSCTLEDARTIFNFYFGPRPA